MEAVFEEIRRIQEQQHQLEQHKAQQLADIENKRIADQKQVKHQIELTKKLEEIERKRKFEKSVDNTSYQLAENQEFKSPVYNQQISIETEEAVHFNLRQAMIQSIILNRKEF